MEEYPNWIVKMDSFPKLDFQKLMVLTHHSDSKTEFILDSFLFLLFNLLIISSKYHFTFPCPNAPVLDQHLLLCNSFLIDLLDYINSSHF